MSLMDPNQIQSKLFENYFFVNQDTVLLNDALNLLIDNNLIEDFEDNCDKSTSFRIHELAQDEVMLFRQKKILN